MPDTFRDRQWDHFLMRQFDFKINDNNIARIYIEQSIGKKWREYRQKLWNAFYDSTMSRNDIVNNVPEGINIEQWASYVDYRLRPEMMALCKRNQENLKKQTIPHTCGAKTLARRNDDLRKEIGKTIGRGLMWNIAHKKKEGSFVNDEAEKIGALDEGSGALSPNDPRRSWNGSNTHQSVDISSLY